MIAGKKVATTKDKNNKDWTTNGENNSFGKNTPTNKLLEKSGNGIIKIQLLTPL